MPSQPDKRKGRLVVIIQVLELQLRNSDSDYQTAGLVGAKLRDDYAMINEARWCFGRNVTDAAQEIVREECAVYKTAQCAQLHTSVQNCTVCTVMTRWANEISPRHLGSASSDGIEVSRVHTFDQVQSFIWAEKTFNLLKLCQVFV